VNKKPFIVVITGAESTGKSTLTKNLAKHYEAEYIPEYAREYIEMIPHKYTFNDVETIAKKQIEQFNILKNKNQQIVFVDTWLIITKIWFEIVFNKIPAWIDLEIAKSEIDLFLICDIDLPWIADSVRENGGKNRIMLHNKYIETINEYGCNYKVIKGENEFRFFNAVHTINRIFEKQ
jgi:NadR type nicotinamide-nucleotide adenylyltransferase